MLLVKIFKCYQTSRPSRLGLRSLSKTENWLSGCFIARTIIYFNDTIFLLQYFYMNVLKYRLTRWFKKLWIQTFILGRDLKEKMWRKKRILGEFNCFLLPGLLMISIWGNMTCKWTCKFMLSYVVLVQNVGTTILYCCAIFI